MAKTHLAVSIGTPGNVGVTGVIKKIYMKQGFAALYRGLGTSIIGITPYASLKLTFYNQLKTFKNPAGTAEKTASSKWVENIGFGGLAGCLAVTVTYPTDLIRRRV